jgi:hypothetical protein
MLSAVDTLTLVLTLPMAVGAALGTHVLASRAVKAVLWSTSPLSGGEPQAYSYERNVYRTAETGAMQIVALALATGLLVWVAGASGSGWLWLLAALAWVATLGLDLLRWERVAVSANNLWFQRGLGQTVHQVAFENIRDVAVEERDVQGLTLRHGNRNRVCRLQVRMNDKRVVALPKTDAHTGLDAVEEVANQLRQRLRHLEGKESLQRSAEHADAAVQAAAARPPADEDEFRRALRRLRRSATAPDAPKAVKLQK